MKRTSRLKALLLTVAFAALTAQSALASTPPCTPINNTATIAYKVGDVVQPSVADAAPEFNVGVKVMVAVANGESNEVTVVPGTGKYALKFTVTNNGSAVQDYDLTYEDAITGTASSDDGANDSFNGATVAIYADTNTNGTYEPATDTTAITKLNDVTADGGSKVVFIVYSPTDLQESNGETAVYHLKATSKWIDDSAITYGATETVTAVKAGGVCGAGTVIPVVAGDLVGPATDDTLNDGEASDVGAYEVSSATIGVTKNSTVIWDPINLFGPVPAPKAIPGAIVRYFVAIANTGGASAVVNSIEDTLENTLQIDARAGFAEWTVTGPTTRTTTNGTLTADTTDGDNDGLGHANTAIVGGTLTADLITILAAEGTYADGELRAGETVTVEFNATIQ